MSEQTLYHRRDSIIAALPERAQVLDFVTAAQTLVASVRGGHVVLYPRGWRLRRTLHRPERTLPLALARLDTGSVYITRTAPGVDTTLVGRQVRSINEIELSTLVERAAYFSGGSDGYNVSGSRNRAARRLGNYLDWAYGEMDSFRIALTDTVVVVPADRPRERQREQRSTKKAQGKRANRRPIGYGLDSARRVAVIDINSFSGYDPYNLRWPRVWRRVLAKAASDSARAVILDLRSNGGGRSANIRRVLRRLVVEETPLYQAWTVPVGGWRYASFPLKVGLLPTVILGQGPDKRFGRLMQHRVKPARGVRYTGPLYVLIDSGTFSAASATAAVLKSSGRATLVGEEAGGNYHETYAGLFSTVSLRRTGLRLRLPHLLIPLDVEEGKQPFGKTLQPDIEIPVDLQDLLDPRDLVLLRLLHEIESSGR